MMPLTSMSILMRVIRWKGSSRKDMKGSRWHRGDSCRRVMTSANWALVFLRTGTSTFTFRAIEQTLLSKRTCYF